MTTESEALFINDIDCKFPYLDRQRCVQLIDQALSISPNAIFAVIEEISRIPSSLKNSVSATTLHELLLIIESKFSHPLKNMILAISRMLIDGSNQRVVDSISQMEIVGKYPRQFAALNIIYFSCEGDKDELDQMREKIVNEWGS